MTDWPTPKMRTAADGAALNRMRGTPHSMVQAGLLAALDAARTADGWVWCEKEETAHRPLASPWPHPEPGCPGPHRALIIGPKVAS